MSVMTRKWQGNDLDTLSRQWKQELSLFPLLAIVSLYFQLLFKWEICIELVGDIGDLYKLPFGGVKASGIGHEHGPEAVDYYLESKGAVFGGLDI